SARASTGSRSGARWPSRTRGCSTRTSCSTGRTAPPPSTASSGRVSLLGFEDLLDVIFEVQYRLDLTAAPAHLEERRGCHQDHRDDEERQAVLGQELEHAVDRGFEGLT